MSQPSLEGLLAFVRSAEARPIMRELIWAGGIGLGLILVAALIMPPGFAYGLYLAVAVFFAATLTGLFVSLLERETGEGLVSSPPLRRWVGGFALVLAVLAALILV